MCEEEGERFGKREGGGVGEGEEGGEREGERCVFVLFICWLVCVLLL